MSSKSYNRGSAAISRRIWEDYAANHRRLLNCRTYVAGVPVDGKCQHRIICFYPTHAVCQECGGEAPSKTKGGSS